MAQEEEKTQSCSGVGSRKNSGIGIGSISRSSSFSKKPKQKKVPQRGLGVAQLEKIRQEENQQNERHHHALVLPSSSSSSATTVISTSSISSQIKPHFPSLPIPYTNSMFRSPPSLGHKPVSGLAGNHYSFPKLISFGDLYAGKESCAVVDHGLAYGTNNPIWHPPPPGLVQRPQQQQQPCSSWLDVSSSSTSSVLNFQMEPPSNQSFGSNYTPMWAAEENKMVRLKRPYPFSLDNPPGLTINYKVRTCVHPSSRSNESTPSDNGGRDNLEPSNHLIREGLLCPSISKSNSKQNLKDNGATDGDFLTLGPPATSNLFTLYIHELPDVEPPLYRGGKEDQYLQPAPSVSKQPYYCFLPPPQGKCCQKPTTTNNLNGSEDGGNLDLDLKL